MLNLGSLEFRAEYGRLLAQNAAVIHGAPSYDSQIRRGVRVRRFEDCSLEAHGRVQNKREEGYDNNSNPSRLLGIEPTVESSVRLRDQEIPAMS